MILNMLAKSDLPVVERYLMYVIALGNQTVSVWWNPTQQHLASITGISQPAVSRALRSLEDHKWIVRSALSGGGTVYPCLRINPARLSKTTEAGAELERDKPSEPIAQVPDTATNTAPTPARTRRSRRQQAPALVPLSDLDVERSRAITTAAEKYDEYMGSGDTEKILLANMAVAYGLVQKTEGV